MGWSVANCISGRGPPPPPGRRVTHRRASRPVSAGLHRPSPGAQGLPQGRRHRPGQGRRREGGKNARMLVVGRMLVGVRQHSNPLRWNGSQGKMGQCWYVGVLVGVHMRPCAHPCQEKEKKNQKERKRPTFIFFSLKSLMGTGVCNVGRVTNIRPTLTNIPTFTAIQNDQGRTPEAL